MDMDMVKLCRRAAHVLMGVASICPETKDEKFVLPTIRLHLSLSGSAFDQLEELRRRLAAC